MNNMVNTSGLICMQLAACAVMSVMSLLSKNSNVTSYAKPFNTPDSTGLH